MIIFTIPGQPTGKGRPRLGKGGHTYTPGKTVNYENLVKWYCQQATKEFYQSEPLEIDVAAYYGIPTSKGKKAIEEMASNRVRPTKKPDADNVLKIICDSLNSICYHDDSQIVRAKIEKYYGVNPRVEVIIKCLE